MMTSPTASVCMPWHVWHIWHSSLGVAQPQPVSGVHSSHVFIIFPTTPWQLTLGAHHNHIAWDAPNSGKKCSLVSHYVPWSPGILCIMAFWLIVSPHIQLYPHEQICTSCWFIHVHAEFDQISIFSQANQVLHLQLAWINCYIDVLFTLKAPP